MRQIVFALFSISLLAMPALAGVQGDGPAGILSIEAENFDAQVALDPNSNWYEIADGSASRGLAMASIDDGTNFNGDDYTEVAPRLDYNCTFVQSGTHYVWLRMRYLTGDADTAHLGINGMGDPNARRIDAPPSAQGAWQWSNFKQNPDGTAMIDIPSAGDHVLNLFVREDGIQIDKILLTIDPNYIPEGVGPREAGLDPLLVVESSLDLVATGDMGMILSINGIDANDLIVGTTTFAGEPKHADQGPAGADNLDLNSDASADDQASMETLFDFPVTQILMVEKGGNDDVQIVPLDREGNALDDPMAISTKDFGKVLKDDGTNLKVYQNQDAALGIITPPFPIWGLRILPPEGGTMGIDPVSISAVAGSILTFKPIDDLNAATDVADANTLTEVLGINGFDADELILASITADFEKFDDHPAADGQNFDLTTYASLDDSTIITMTFDLPVSTIFIMERGANDTALIQPIDAEGNAIGGPGLFVSKDTQFQDSGLKIVGQKAGGMAIVPDRPINGIVITPAPGKVMGIDPASVSAIPILPEDSVYLEAEAANVLGASWRLLEDPNASGGQAIGSDDGDGNDNGVAPGPEWVASYDFSVAGGSYNVVLRGQEAGSDSFWVRILGATSQSLEDPDQPGTGWVRFNGFDAPSWGWDKVHSDDHSRDIPVKWKLPEGPLTLEIAKREDGMYLDAILITNVLSLDEGTLPDAIPAP